MNGFLIAAAIAAAGVAALHLFVGGKGIARPLLKSRDMHDVVRLTSYYCWHMVTIILAGLAIAFAWAAIEPAAMPAAAFATALCICFAILSFVLVVSTGQRHRHMPQWMLFTGLTALSLPGLLT
jgi:hypothetical protein